MKSLSFLFACYGNPVIIDRWELPIIYDYRYLAFI